METTTPKFQGWEIQLYAVRIPQWKQWLLRTFIGPVQRASEGDYTLELVEWRKHLYIVGEYGVRPVRGR